MAEDLTHFDPDGRARMVDVGDKPETNRRAVAMGHVVMQPATGKRILDGQIGKGDVLQVARLAGIMAAKKTADIIPLCHPLPLTAINIDLKISEDLTTVEIVAECKTSGKTGVEMEALTAVSVSALTVYDMAKAIDREMKIEGIKLLFKSGGKSGTFEASS
ncbi:MAG: cyclic pyranopterin monophosphate synthase MoaC [Alphaproteobacteria bacterium]|nr:cyclic pyranopterin monophosphate synthase MoaC [Alphaproteobacteria bacterium]